MGCLLSWAPTYIYIKPFTFVIGAVYILRLMGEADSNDIAGVHTIQVFLAGIYFLFCISGSIFNNL